VTRIRAALIAAIALATLLAVAAPASASAPLKVTYHATGTSTIASTGSKVKLGPSTLSISLHRDGTFTATLPLPPVQTSFKAAGLLPTTATVSFVPKGKVTGSLKAGKRTVVTSVAKDYLHLSNVKVAGVDQMVGDSCQTVKPVVLHVATPAGKSFNLDKGGALAGTFSIGDFAGCGTNPITEALNNALINQLVPGDGNKISLTLSHGKLAG
jgi:hypothetical protein